MPILSSALVTQFEAGWNLLDEAVDAFTDEAWRCESATHLVPARTAYHLIETADYYSHADLSRFPWGERFGVDWETAPAPQLPDRAQIAAYAMSVREKMAAWIVRLSDPGLLNPDEVFHDEGMTHLDRALYVLRHMHQHLGELFAVLRENGIARPGWR
jgi:uncharacterized damage-inducible protein DinB